METEVVAHLADRDLKDLHMETEMALQQEDHLLQEAMPQRERIQIDQEAVKLQEAMLQGPIRTDQGLIALLQERQEQREQEREDHTEIELLLPVPVVLQEEESVQDATLRERQEILVTRSADMMLTQLVSRDILGSQNSSEEKLPTEPVKSLIHLRVVLQECQDLVTHSSELIVHKEVLVQELERREDQDQLVLVAEDQDLQDQEAIALLQERLELQGQLSKHCYDSIINLKAFRWIGRFFVKQKSAGEGRSFIVDCLMFLRKAPVGFEPTIEGFAGPAIRPLWHSATIHNNAVDVKYSLVIRLGLSMFCLVNNILWGILSVAMFIVRLRSARGRNLE